MTAVVPSQKNTEEIELPFGWFSRTVLVLFAAAILGLVLGTFIEQGFHWRLPDNPERNELLYDLGFKRYDFQHRLCRMERDVG